jgi:hypothetical protein
LAWGCLLAVAGCGDDDGAGASEGKGAGEGDHASPGSSRSPAQSGGGGTGGFSAGTPPPPAAPQGGAGAAFGPGQGAFDPSTGAAGSSGGNTNVSLGGAQDFGFYRSQLAAGIIPALGDYDAAGFFAEHHTALPEPDCGERVCLQAMLGVLGNLMNGQNCTMLQLGLNSPIAADASERPPLNLAVVVDVSGSMNTDGKIDFVRAGLYECETRRESPPEQCTGAGLLASWPQGGYSELVPSAEG